MDRQTSVSLPCKYIRYGSLTQCSYCETAHDSGDESFQCPYCAQPVLTKWEQTVAILRLAKPFFVVVFVSILLGSLVLYLSNTAGKHISRHNIAELAYRNCLVKNLEQRCAEIRTEVIRLLEGRRQ